VGQGSAYNCTAHKKMRIRSANNIAVQKCHGASQEVLHAMQAKHDGLFPKVTVCLSCPTAATHVYRVIILVE